MPGGWSVPTLLDALSAAVGIPRRQLAFAKLSQAGGGVEEPTAAQLGGLVWDDPAVLASPKVSAAPLLLCDGDVLVVRDCHHPAPAPPAQAQRARRATFAAEGHAAGGGPRIRGFEGDDARSAAPATSGGAGGGAGNKSGRGVSFG